MKVKDPDLLDWTQTKVKEIAMNVVTEGYSASSEEETQLLG